MSEFYYVAGSVLGDLERRMADTRAAAEAARARFAAVNSERAALEKRWASARLSDIEPAAFAVMAAKIELLGRDLAPLQAAVAVAEAAARDAETEYGTKRRQLERAQKAHERAEDHDPRRVNALILEIEGLTAARPTRQRQP